MQPFSTRVATGILAAVLVGSGAAAAQGFGVYEQGGCAMGRAGAGVASPCADGSSIFFNPANIASTPDVVSLGGTLILPRGAFTNDATGIRGSLLDKTYPVPNVYITKSHALTGSINRLAVGAGLFAPYGLTTDWPATFEGRFIGYKSVIRGLYLQPTAAIQLFHRVNAGIGLDIDFAKVQLRRRIDLSGQLVAPGLTFAQLGVAAGTDFADADLEATSTSWGFHVGASVKVNDWIDIGARYLSRHTVEFNGGTARIAQVPTGLVVPVDLPNPANPAQIAIPAGTPIDQLLAPEFASGGVLATQPATTSLRFPDQFVFGAAVRPVHRLTLLGDVQYTHWKLFQEVAIIFAKLPAVVLRQDNEDTWGFRLGGEYDLDPRLTLRAGYYTHDGAEPPQAVTPNLPEGGRHSFTVGLGSRVGRDFRIDAAYQYIDQVDRRGRTVAPAPGTLPTVALNNGLYTFHAHLVGATVSYAF